MFLLYSCLSACGVAFYFAVVPELSSVELDSKGGAYLPPGFVWLVGEERG